MEVPFLTESACWLCQGGSLFGGVPVRVDRLGETDPQGILGSASKVDGEC